MRPIFLVGYRVNEKFHTIGKSHNGGTVLLNNFSIINGSYVVGYTTLEKAKRWEEEIKGIQKRYGDDTTMIIKRFYTHNWEWINNEEIITDQLVNFLDYDS